LVKGPSVDRFGLPLDCMTTNDSRPQIGYIRTPISPTGLEDAER
jgi:hypothetical protein